MRIRLRFAKHGKVRFTSHRDLARIWERSLRRGNLPVAYSVGFSPRPKLHFGLALPTGYESDAEYLDVDLVEGTEVDLDTLPELLVPTLPVGVTATAAGPVEPGSDSLQHAVVSCSWRLEVDRVGVGEVADAVERLLAAPELVVTRQRKGKDVVDDIRPHIEALSAVGPSPDGGVELACELATRTRGLRPSELLRALAVGRDTGRGRRTHQWIEIGGARGEPLEATPAPHAQARAS